jgi:hypothetical protein
MQGRRDNRQSRAQHRRQRRVGRRGK